MPRRAPDRARRRRPAHARSRFLPAALALALVAGCATGQRPYFDDSPTAVGAMTGDPAVDAVLDRLDDVAGATFTAQYTVVNALGQPFDAAATQEAAARRRSVTIGNVRFIIDPQGARTCRVAERTCEEGLLPERVSDTNLTPTFVFGDMATRLRIDATRNVAPTTTTTQELGGQGATCVAVPVSGGTKQYCALDSGVLASFVGADVQVTMTGYRPEVDPALMAV